MRSLWLSALVLVNVAVPQTVDPYRNDFQHAVNTQLELAQFLKSDIRIAEGDISLVDGKLVMFHPPRQGKVVQEKVDLGFRDWFIAVLKAGKGVKLDIKGDSKTSDKVIEEIEGVLRGGLLPQGIMKKAFVIANADLVKGPGGNAPEIKVDEMIRWREKFPGIRISVGYTDENNDNGDRELYTKAMVKEMIDTIAQVSGIKGKADKRAAIDINLRGKRIADPRNKEMVKKLLDGTPKEIRKDLSITVWNWAKHGDRASEADKKYFKSLISENPANVLLDL